MEVTIPPSCLFKIRNHLQRWWLWKCGKRVAFSKQLVESVGNSKSYPWDPQLRYIHSHLTIAGKAFLRWYQTITDAVAFTPQGNNMTVME